MVLQTKVLLSVLLLQGLAAAAPAKANVDIVDCPDCVTVTDFIVSTTYETLEPTTTTTTAEPTVFAATVAEPVSTATITSTVFLQRTCEPAATITNTITEAPVTITEPPVTITEPPVTVTEPAVTVTEPPVTVTEPAVTVTEPPVTVTEPATTVTEPAVTVTEPAVTVTEPPVTVTEPATTVTAVGLGAAVTDIVTDTVTAPETTITPTTTMPTTSSPSDTPVNPDCGTCADLTIRYEEVQGQQSYFPTNQIDFPMGASSSLSAVTRYMCNRLATNCGAPQSTIDGCSEWSALLSSEGATGQAGVNEWNNLVSGNYN